MESDYQKFHVTDANFAAAEIGYSMSDMCFIYPITPSSSMGEKADDLAAHDTKNIFGNVVQITQMQSEGGVSGALHGAILSGALSSTFTCSQGLLLMIPEMFKIAGELQPAVFHISTRSVGGQAMNIYSDHGDIMATRQTGWVMLNSHSVQQAADLAVIAHAASIRGQLPFTHFFDGFRVSHELQKILVPTPKLMTEMMDREAIRQWREKKPMKNSDATMRGLVNNADIYFPLLEGSNTSYNNMITIVKDCMAKYATLTGRNYQLFNYIGHPEAEYVVVALGTACMTFEEFVMQPEIKEKRKFGLIAVHLFHPFSIEDFVNVLPKTCKHITILDRTKEPGAAGEPLYLECLAALHQAGRLTNMKVSAGRYGLGGRDVTPAVAHAVFMNMCGCGIPDHKPRYRFTVGIEDDVTHLSLPMPKEKVIVSLPGVKQALFYGFGADGTVGAVKDAIKIIGDNTDLYSQAYFVYDAKKSGGVTISHIRFGPSPITSQYEILDADYLACHHPSYIRKYDMVSQAKEGGVFVLNGAWKTTEELEKALPGQMRKAIVEKKLKFYVIDAEKIAEEAGLKGRINNVMQTVFFYLSSVLPMDKAIELQKAAIQKTYLRKGMEVVEKNWKCVDATITNLLRIEPPAEWIKGEFETIPVFPDGQTEYFKKIAAPVLGLKGEELTVSDLMAHAAGCMPTNTGRFEKRNVSSTVPTWNDTKCVQCNLCSFVCPHATIRPFLVTEKEVKENNLRGIPTKPAQKITIDSTEETAQFTISISTADCLGCSMCATVCPTKALTMGPNHTPETDAEQTRFDFLVSLPDRSRFVYNTAELEKKARESGVAIPPPTVKNVQFKRPLFEFSAACAGCTEAPVVRLITQMFGERMMIANSCGCSMVWGGYSPSCPYSHNEEGCGPAYTGSLFEDTAEFAYGITVAGQHLRSQLLAMVEQAKDLPEMPGTPIGSDVWKNECASWIEKYNEPNGSKTHGLEIVRMLGETCHAMSCPCTGGACKAKSSVNSVLPEMWSLRDLFQKKSYWCFGGDGWAYDIGFGGLDQVLHMGAKMNILVMDTEVYSNTGGQKSKSTPRGAIARFAAAGKPTSKKDLGLYAMNLGCCYVATVAQGANPQQLIRALHEAEEFPGTSIVIALCPCINWGMKEGMKSSMTEQKIAVECGYWPLYRYNPHLVKEGKNPLTLDSAAPKRPVSDLLSRENRFSQLMTQSPEVAKDLHESLQLDCDARYKKLQMLHAGFAPAPKTTES